MMHLNNNLRKIIEEEFKNILETVSTEELRDTKKYSIPTEVSNTARSALAIVKRNNLVQTENPDEGSGLQKAKTLEQGGTINHGQLEKMQTFLSDKKKARVEATEMAGGTIENSGLIQMWNLYGGDAAYKWVKKEISKTSAEGIKRKERRNSDLNDKNILDPFHDTRIHSALSKVQNR